MLDPFTTASRLTPIHQMSLAVLSHAACASMSTTTPTTTTTTTTTTRDRGDRYGPWNGPNQYGCNCCRNLPLSIVISVTAITVLFVFTNFTYFVVLGIDGVLHSEAVAVVRL